MDWKTCTNTKQAKPINPDHELANALEKTSINKSLASHELKLRTETAAAKISLSYDAVRELLEAIALRKGFKIYNHICYTALLKELLNQTAFGEEFDELRKIRNDINYYGKEVSTEEAQSLLQQCEALRHELLKLLETIKQ
jgi:uncharacterized protein (UPF0332 family)